MALAVCGARHSPVLPEVPTVAQAGMHNVDACSRQEIAAARGRAASGRDEGLTWCCRASNPFDASPAMFSPSVRSRPVDSM